MGKYVNDTITGVSSNRINPFFILYKTGTTEDYGEAYGFNLIYSGNHRSTVEVDSINNMRITEGINPDTFEFTLKEMEEFEVPETVLSYSKEGFNKLSQNFHDYINNHIIDENFRRFP